MCGCQAGVYLFKRRGGNPVVICPGSSSPSASLGESSRWSGSCKAQAKGSVVVRDQTPRSLRDEPSTELCLGMLFPRDPCPAWQREGITGTWVGSPCPPHQGNELKVGLANRSQWINTGNDLCASSCCANGFTRDEDDGSSVIKTNFVSDVNKRLHYTSVYLTTLHLGNQQIRVANGTVHHSGRCWAPALSHLQPHGEPARSRAGNGAPDCLKLMQLRKRYDKLLAITSMTSKHNSALAALLSHLFAFHEHSSLKRG